MKTYKVPVVWTMMAYVEVEAESLDEAINEVMNAPLPDNGEYLEDSFEVDHMGLMAEVE
jgi:hypothetical protein